MACRYGKNRSARQWFPTMVTQRQAGTDDRIFRQRVDFRTDERVPAVGMLCVRPQHMQTRRSRVGQAVPGLEVAAVRMNMQHVPILPGEVGRPQFAHVSAKCDENLKPSGGILQVRRVAGQSAKQNEERNFAIGLANRLPRQTFTFGKGLQTDQRAVMCKIMNPSRLNATKGMRVFKGSRAGRRAPEMGDHRRVGRHIVT